MKELLNEIKPQILEIFQHLHENPEVSWNEYQSTSFISNILHQNDLEVTSFEDMPGIVGNWHPDERRKNFTVGLRADMDALLQEVDGTIRANHSCGHDAHMTIVLGVLLVLKKMKINLPGTLKFIFQPAEEVGEGALKMIEKQVLEDVDFLYGLHLRPIQEMKLGQASSGIIHGSADTVYGEIHGFDGHGARPHLTLNTIEVITSIVDQLKGIRLNPQISYSVKMTQVSAGGENANIIPGSSKFSLDLRAQTNEAMDELIEKVEDVLKKMSVFHQCQISFQHKERVYAASIDQEAERFMEKAIEKTLGAKGVVRPIITPGGEDFHFYTKERPAIKATMLGVGCDLEPGLHHPNMVFNHDAIFTGIEILTRAVIETFSKDNK
ncbi:M20 peptidase aminoacylase family protein [Peribacillus simplex]|uniref:M20 peptidase aminoacylase family protein n=1 Tax=Peribacillus simplex TaxID=1478 RepID=UPI0024C1FDB1|nr:M20 peptidase aminoacylase family protein [Peribacillus simplex]WHY99548.1 M20 peptidase aminoacylase family protein [Peribacillus simplex]